MQYFFIVLILHEFFLGRFVNFATLYRTLKFIVREMFFLLFIFNSTNCICFKLHTKDQQTLYTNLLVSQLFSRPLRFTREWLLKQDFTHFYCKTLFRFS